MLTLHVKEDDLFAIAIMVLCAYNILSPVFQLNPVDDEGVIVTVVPFHKFDRLSQFLVIVRPTQGRRCDRDHTASELHALSLVGKRALRLDDKSRRRLSAIWKRISIIITNRLSMKILVSHLLPVPTLSIKEKRKIINKYTDCDCTLITHRSRSRRFCICRLRAS